MKLDKTKDYTILSDKGKQEQEKIECEKVKLPNSKTSHSKFSKEIRHYNSLFPNNYIDICTLKSLENEKILKEFKELINEPETKESDISKFIKDKNAYFIIASLLRETSYGHHDVYVFPEFQLSDNSKVDYLIIGKSSQGYHFLFVEIEGVNKDPARVDGFFSDNLKQPERQIATWKSSLETNYSSIFDVFKKAKKCNTALTDEFHKYDPSRMDYAVIIGKRQHETDNSNKDIFQKEKRKSIETNKTTIKNYDNLLDLAELAVKNGSF